jgi:hypothetical protein
MTPVSNELTDRYGERKGKAKLGRLLAKTEKEQKKTVLQSRKE